MKLIDQEQIEQLKMIAGDDKDIAAAFFNKLIASFETSVPGKVIELRSHFVSQNILDLKKTAHYLKSTFGNLGMSQLQTCVLEIEKSCQANQLNGVEERIQIVEKELAPHLAELKGLVSEPLASESLLKSS